MVVSVPEKTVVVLAGRLVVGAPAVVIPGGVVLEPAAVEVAATAALVPESASTCRALIGRTACSAVCSPARRTAPQATAPVVAVAASQSTPNSSTRFTE
jgi:hypothetical protein